MNPCCKNAAQKFCPTLHIKTSFSLLSFLVLLLVFCHQSHVSISLPRLASRFKNLYTVSNSCFGFKNFSLFDTTMFCDSLQVGRSGDRIPVEVRFSVPDHNGSEAHPASCTKGTGSFSGVKRPGLGADHPPLLVPRFRMLWSYTSASALCLHRRVIG